VGWSRALAFPINNKDSYNLCDFRVKLDVDEPVVKFTKDFYFMFWGLSTKKGKYIYDLSTNKVSKSVFYTQKTYNKLFDKAFKSGEINLPPR
jgi:hypothetical protein